MNRNKFITDAIMSRKKPSAKMLYRFSKVSLKRVRVRKKFDKNCRAYVPKWVWEAYVGLLMAYPISKIFDSPLLEIDPMLDCPNIKIVYSDYRYENKLV